MIWWVLKMPWTLRLSNTESVLSIIWRFLVHTALVNTSTRRIFTMAVVSETVKPCSFKKDGNESVLYISCVGQHNNGWTVKHLKPRTHVYTFGLQLWLCLTKKSWEHIWRIRPSNMLAIVDISYILKVGGTRFKLSLHLFCTNNAYYTLYNISTDGNGKTSLLSEPGYYGHYFWICSVYKGERSRILPFTFFSVPSPASFNAFKNFFCHSITLSWSCKCKAYDYCYFFKLY